jgi:hypothetical protein
MSYANPTGESQPVQGIREHHYSHEEVDTPETHLPRMPHEPSSLGGHEVGLSYVKLNIHTDGRLLLIASLFNLFSQLDSRYATSS